MRRISGRGELDPFLLAGGFRHAQKCCWTVHAFLAESYGRLLTSMLVELAMMHLYGVPERHTTIVKRCDMKLDAARLAARTCKACVWSCKRIEPQTQGGGWQRPGECRARPSARAAGMASSTKAVAAHSRPQDGPLVLRVSAHRRLKTWLAAGCG